MNVDENNGEIRVYIFDASYDTKLYADREVDEAALSEEFRSKIESEFGMHFQSANIGSGADLPSFVTVLSDALEVPIWPILVGVFFLGKPISENLDAWSNVYKKIVKFLNRRTVFDRNGAAVLAIDALVKKQNELPNQICLLSYRAEKHLQYDDFLILEQADTIANPVDEVWLGDSWHVFEIEMDGAIFRVGVNSNKVHVLLLSCLSQNNL